MMQPNTKKDRVNHVIQAAYSGPIPAAEQFARYDEILPGAANRILTMAEQEQGNRLSANETNIKLQKIYLEKSWQYKFIGLIFAFIMGLIIIGFGAYLAISLKEVRAGVGIVVSLLIPTFIAFIAGKYYKSTS